MLQELNVSLVYIRRIFNAIVSCRSSSEACLLACQPYEVLPGKKSPVVREVEQASSCGPPQGVPNAPPPVAWPGGPAPDKAT